MEKPILVVAIGGNALLQRGELMSCENQRKASILQLALWPNSTLNTVWSLFMAMVHKLVCWHCKISLTGTALHTLSMYWAQKLRAWLVIYCNRALKTYYRKRK